MVIHAQVLTGAHTDEPLPDLNFANAALPSPWPSTGNMLHWDAFFNHAMTVPVLDQLQTCDSDAQQVDLETWTSDFFDDAMFDWIGRDNQG